MDKKSLLIFGLSFALLLAWGPLVDNVLYPIEDRRTPVQTNELAGATSPGEGGDQAGASETGSESVGNSTVAATENAATPAAPPVGVPPAPALPDGFEATSLTLENEVAQYRFDNGTGGLGLVDLTQYPNDTGCDPASDDGEASVESTYAQVNPWSAEPILGLTLEGLPAIRGFQMTQEGTSVRLVRDLENGLQIEKTFELGTNYLLQARTRISNTRDQAVTVPKQHWGIGTATPIAPEDRGILMGWLYHAEGEIERVKESWFANRTLGCFPGRPRSLFSFSEAPVNWASVDNQFFTVAVVPSEPAAGMEARPITLDFPEESAAAFSMTKGCQADLVFEAKTLQPGEAIENEFQIFAGPKEYNTLARLAGTLGNDLDGIMDFDGFFGFFAKALLLSMNGLHGVGLSYGFAIVAITFIIKLLFWPLTQASTRSMKRMAALQPQMKEIQEKYKDDPQKMNRKLMEFMREKRVSPLGGCLPILLQLPVFFGFYTMLQSAIELRGASFLWTCDLSKPDTLFVIPGLDIPFNLWPILMGAAQLWQMSMTPPSPGMDPAQQKIMKYMPLMFVFILYNFSAGLALYWTVQNLLSIVQMKLTKNEPIDTASPAPVGKKRGKGGKKRG